MGDWLGLLTERFEQAGDDHGTAAMKATLAVAMIRGLLLDLLTTNDSARVRDALESFSASLSSLTSSRQATSRSHRGQAQP